MARPAQGQVVERRTSGRRVFALRFQAYGRRRYLSLGSGTSRSQAEEELANVLADVRRGVWRLPEPETSLVERPPDPTFHEFASRWYAETVAEWRQSTRADYLWQLEKHLLPFFAAHRLSEITVAEVDRYRHEKVAQATLSATSINKTITRLGQVLEVAVERELIARNPARVGGKRRRLKVTRPRRSYLDRADQIAALLDAAGQLDAEAASNRGHGRRALLATLTFGGLRIGEALALDWRDVDLAGGRLTVRTSKTDAGVRTVDLVAVLRDELLANRARAGDVDPEAPVFPSAAGRRHDRNHVRNRVAPNLRQCPRRAGPRPGVRVMAQLGHTDPQMTLGIYAQVMQASDEDRERLRELVEGRVWARKGTGSLPMLSLETRESTRPAGFEPAASRSGARHVGGRRRAGIACKPGRFRPFARATRNARFRAESGGFGQWDRSTAQTIPALTGPERMRPQRRQVSAGSAQHRPPCDRERRGYGRPERASVGEPPFGGQLSVRPERPRDGASLPMGSPHRGEVSLRGGVVAPPRCA